MARFRLTIINHRTGASTSAEAAEVSMGSPETGATLAVKPDPQNPKRKIMAVRPPEMKSSVFFTAPGTVSLNAFTFSAKTPETRRHRPRLRQRATVSPSR